MSRSSMNPNWYLYPHDELLERVLNQTEVADTVSWSERGDLLVLQFD